MTVGTAVAPGVRLAALPLPFALRVVNAYLVEGERGWALVDTGLHTLDGERALRSALADAGIDLADVRRTFVTHVHPDHIGMAGLLESAGSEIVMHAPEADHAKALWQRGTELADASFVFFGHHGMPPDVDDEMRAAWLEIGSRVDRWERVTPVGDGDEIDLGGKHVRVVWTPGHTDHHAALFDASEGILFAGDHVLPHITSNISLYPWSRPDPLGDFLDALRAVRALPVRRVLPAHGDAFDDLPRRVDELLEHHRERLERVLALVRVRERDAYAICRDLFPVLRSAHEQRFALAETLAHLRHLERRGRIAPVAGEPIRWREAG